MQKRIINTKKDFERAIDPHSSQFAAALEGEKKKLVNVTVYPEDYDHNLKSGDEGFIEPIFEEVQNTQALTKFGVLKNGK